ncbi:MAG: hypothetical protein EXR73_09480 [Myxococcales bacterium]|nr:hypothetical protein [Myxococcales bacterium]
MDCPCVSGPDDACTGDNICVNGTCVNAFGRTYQIVVSHGSMTTQDPACSCAWDGLGGAPDPFVMLSFDASGANSYFRTNTIQDTFAPDWSDVTSTVIFAGTPFRFDVWDDDVTTDDWMFACLADPLTAAYLRYGTMSCVDDYGSTATIYIYAQ